MLKLCGHLNLTPESPPIYFSGELRREQFDDDFSAERFLCGHENAAHSSASELALDVVGVGKGVGELFFESRHCAGTGDSRKRVWYCLEKSCAIFGGPGPRCAGSDGTLINRDSGEIKPTVSRAVPKGIPTLSGTGRPPNDEVQVVGGISILRQIRSFDRK